ncbi:DUF2187 family protein [Bacillus sp. FJAT-29937]|uniref:DUF2187 family protein n=1 Tax=Bacillus sp. FJAT-29937 TaxID=1720553 RepID=UPI000833AC8B|nr:DUF2187 family protein [Bacillus sp. FJAT-29937]
MSKKADIGDHVTFNRKDCKMTGIVYLVRDNSVLVEISQKDRELLNLETNKTIVAHKNYTVSKKANKKMPV